MKKTYVVVVYSTIGFQVRGNPIEMTDEEVESKQKFLETFHEAGSAVLSTPTGKVYFNTSNIFAVKLEEVVSFVADGEMKQYTGEEK